MESSNSANNNTNNSNNAANGQNNAANLSQPTTNGQQQQQPAEALNAAAVQQAIAAFQASVEQATATQNHPMFAAATAAPGITFPQPTTNPAPALPNPMLLPTPATAPTTAAASTAAAQQQQQQLWQQAWLSALLPAQQAALAQPYLAAALNPLQQQQQQSLLPPSATALLPNQIQCSNKRKAPGTTVAAAAAAVKTDPQDRKQAATVVSNDSTVEKPPVPKTEDELALMSQSERRRYERNLREQQRSYKISQQIKQLRDVLEESNIPFRPNKYSILVNVAEYIKQLQSRAIMLDSEHQRLIDTIRNTTEQSSQVSILQNTKNASTPALESDAPLVQGIDYRSVFHNARFPLGVATLDGRVLACNTYMEELLQTKSSIIDQSFFVFIRNHQEIFEAMADLLKRSTATIETGEGTVTKSSRLLFWCGHILSSTNQTFPFTITLTNDANDNPKFFSLSAAIPPPPSS